MLPFIKMLPILALIFFSEITQIIAKLEMEGFQNEWIIEPNSSQFFVQGDYRHTFERKEQTFHVAICEMAGLNEVVCNVKWQRRFTVNFCRNTRLRPKDETRMLYDPYNINLLPFDDTVMLVWLERSRNATTDSYDYLGVKILNMSKCQSKRLAFLVDYSASFFYTFPLVMYHNTVDFFIDNNKLCGYREVAERNKVQPPICRITYNLTGTRIDVPRPFLPMNDMIGYIHPVLLEPNHTSFFSSTVDVSCSQLIVSLIDLDGKTIDLMRAKLNETEDFVQVMMGQSNDQGMYSICWVSQLGSNSIACTQFDAYGKLTLNVSVQAEKAVKWVDVRNLAEGGIMAIAGRCSKNEKLYYFDCLGFRIWKIRPDGSYDVPSDVGGLDLRCFDVEDGFTMYVAENNAGDKFCFYFTCMEVSNGETGLKRTLQFSSRCIPK